MTVLQNVARASNRSMLVLFGVLSALVTLAAALLFAGLPTTAISGDAVRLLVIIAALFLSLLIAIRGARATQDLHELTLRSGFVLWVFLLAAETFFARPNNGEDAVLAGNFNLNAYGEAITWIVIGLALIPITLNSPGYIKKLFSGNYKYVSLFAILCLFSVVYAPQPLFSLAWAIKLILGTLILCLILNEIRDMSELRSFLWLTFWVFAFLTAEPILEGILSGDAFAGAQVAGKVKVEVGRFHTTAHPLTIGGRAAILGLLSLLFYTLEKRKWLIGIALGCMVAISITAAKTPFVAAAIAILFFFMMRKKIGPALIALGSMVVIAFIVMQTTPVGEYMRDYMSMDETSSLSGRTELWQLAMSEILHKPILGHGYVSSKLISAVINLQWFAGQMHNAFLETLYNTGFVGLFLMVMVNVLTVNNLWKIAKYPPNPQVRLLSIGLLAMYVYMLLNGMSDPYFGGEATAFFLFYLALFSVSEVLRRLVATRIPTHRELPARFMATQSLDSPSFLNR